MLGWVIDTALETIELPQHRSERLLTILQSLTNKRRVSLKTWQQHLGDLQSMVLALLPGARGLFSTYIPQSNYHRPASVSPNHSTMLCWTF